MKEFKANTWAFDVIAGWVFLGTYIDIQYPLAAGTSTYTKDGKIQKSHTYPRLLDYDPFNGTKPPEPKIDWRKVPRDTPVLVSDDGVEFYEKYFSYTNELGQYVCFDSGKKSFESIRTNAWQHIKLNCELNPEWLVDDYV